MKEIEKVRGERIRERGRKRGERMRERGRKREIKKIR